MRSNRSPSQTSLKLTLFVGILGSCVSAAAAQNITVTTAFDVVDVSTSARIADLPGPDGVVSFREALRVSDNEPGRQTIIFQIPTQNWYLPNIFQGQVMLQGKFNWVAAQPVTIDGTTQTAFTGNTFPDGHEVCAYGLSVSLNGAGTIIQGFHDTRVSLNGPDAEIFNNTGGMYITASVAGGAYIHDNQADTIALSYSDNNLVVRNTTQRVRITGLGSIDPAEGNIIGGPNPADRNFITGFGNYGEHGTPAGHGIELFYTRNTLIQNNYIGTTPDGMNIANRACTIGIAMYSGNHDVLVRDNLIAIQSIGVGPVTGVLYGQEIYIELYEGGSGIEITGNTLGLNVIGQPLLAGVHGVLVNHLFFEDGGAVQIGGAAPGQGNTIAGHAKNGVQMHFGPGVPQSGHIRLSGNSIYSNGDIGIDLLPNTWTFGVTPNDLLDADQGANGLQNFPVLTQASIVGNGLSILGSLNSRASRTYRIEVFASGSCHQSGHGPGAEYLGGFEVQTNAAGNATFSTSAALPATGRQQITATATDLLLGDTSEFSACLALSTPSCYANCDGSTVAPILTANDFACFLTRFAAGNPYADCDAIGGLTANDFACFLNQYSSGCP